MSRATGAHAEDEPYRGAEGPISNLTTHTTITPSLLKIESRSKFPVPGSIGYAGLDVENDVSDRLLSVSEVGPGRLTPETRTSSAGALMDRISALPTGSSQQLKAALMVLMRQAGSLNGDDVSVCGSVEKAGVQGGVGDSGSQGVVVGVEQLHQALPQPQPHRPSQAGAAAGQLPHCPRVQSDTTSLAGFNCFNVVLPSRPMWTKVRAAYAPGNHWPFTSRQPRHLHACGLKSMLPLGAMRAACKKVRSCSLPRIAWVGSLASSLCCSSGLYTCKS